MPAPIALVCFHSSALGIGSVVRILPVVFWIVWRRSRIVAIITGPHTKDCAECPADNTLGSCAVQEFGSCTVTLGLLSVPNLATTRPH